MMDIPFPFNQVSPLNHFLFFSPFSINFVFSIHFWFLSPIILLSRPPPPPLPKSQPPILLSVGGNNTVENHDYDDDDDLTTKKEKDDGIILVNGTSNDGESGTKCRSLQVEKDKDFKSHRGVRGKTCATVSGIEEQVRKEEEVNEVSKSDHIGHVKESQQEVPVIVPKCVSNETSNVWFRSDLSRAAAEEHLLSNDLPDGSFVIRPGASSHTFPYSLSLLFGGKVYHLNIRKVIENHEQSCPSSGSSRQMFSLGKSTITPGRCFESLEQLVQFYANKPLLLVSTRNKQPEISQGSEDRRKQVKLLLL